MHNLPLLICPSYHLFNTFQFIQFHVISDKGTTPSMAVRQISVAIIIFPGILCATNEFPDYIYNEIKY